MRELITSAIEKAALKDLAAKDIVYNTDGGWIVYDRLFAEYLRSRS